MRIDDVMIFNMFWASVVDIQRLYSKLLRLPWTIMLKTNILFQGEMIPIWKTFRHLWILRQVLFFSGSHVQKRSVPSAWQWTILPEHNLELYKHVYIYIYSIVYRWYVCCVPQKLLLLSFPKYSKCLPIFLLTPGHLFGKVVRANLLRFLVGG